MYFPLRKYMTAPRAASRARPVRSELTEERGQPWRTNQVVGMVLGVRSGLRNPRRLTVLAVAGEALTT
jgi:hypothetical protein